MLSFESEKTQALQSNVILYQVNMSWKPLSNGSVAILLITKLTKASYFGLIKDLYRKEDTQDRKKVLFFTDPSYQYICLFICFFSFFFMEFLDYMAKKSSKDFFIWKIFWNCKDNQERSPRMIWELVLLYACFCY